MMDHPTPASLRRCWPWQDRVRDADLERIAHHEAGHVVLMQWLGVDGMRAEASATGGQALLPPGLLSNLGEPGPDETGILSATAAAALHAGFEAERLLRGEPWLGPTLAPMASDFQIAEALLAPRFGFKSSAGHGWAGRLARHVLEQRWERVEQIAQALIERGTWASTDQEGAAACPPTTSGS